MRSRMFFAGLAIAVAAAPALVQPTAASPLSSNARVKASANQLYFDFDGNETLKKGTRVRDASGHKHAGMVLSEGGGQLKSVKGFKRGRAAGFPGRCHNCGRAIIEIADRKGLDPGRRGFSFGVTVKVTARQAKSGSNLVQKGYFGQAGGQYKLQLDPGGIPTCVFYGSAARIKVTSPVGIANGKWRRITCTRTDASLRLGINGKLRAEVTGDVGRISNAAPVRLGGKKITPRNKQFHGILDNAYLRFTPTR